MQHGFSGSGNLVPPGNAESKRRRTSKPRSEDGCPCECTCFDHPIEKLKLLGEGDCMYEGLVNPVLMGVGITRASRGIYRLGGLRTTLFLGPFTQKLCLVYDRARHSTHVMCKTRWVTFSIKHGREWSVEIDELERRRWLCPVQICDSLPQQLVMRGCEPIYCLVANSERVWDGARGKTSQRR